jgi:CotH kinase protein/Lamin Tail Domain/Chitobiase/beta-hexosaminidase C-terminal domain
MNKLQFALVLMCLGLASVFTANGQVVINEYSASNLNQFVDNHSDYEDWIELYNPTGSTINLGGHYLSDDSTNNLKWMIPNGVTIGPNGFTKIWASGRDEISGTSYHANFKLKQTKSNKEDIVLSNQSGVIIDGLRLEITQLGHSRGRTINGGTTWGIFTIPTPGATNNSTVSYTRYADRPDFSVPAGFYSATQQVVITNTEPAGTSSIRYTTTGNLPTSASTLFSTPVIISSTTVLKAITFSTDPTVLPSLIEYETYFINVSHTLPVMSISATSLTTLANGSGTLRPYGAFEYFDTTGTRVTSGYGEFNRHGQDSWVLSQRSLDFVTRDEMGYNNALKHQIFQNTLRDDYQRIMIRASGDDNYPADHRPANAGSAHIRDAYIHMLASRGQMNLDVRLSNKCVVYLNGAYWGVYDLRDNPDDADNTEYYYGQDKYDLHFIETWGNTWAQYGGNNALTEWSNLYTYIMTNSMADPVKYQYVIDRYDATSLVDYVIVNAMTVCSDWLNYNTGWWRGLDTTGTHQRWGYILWDNDATFGHYINYTGIPNTNFDADPCDPEGLSGNSDPEGHIQVLNRLRQNPDFEQYYRSRFIDMWNTVWSCDNMIPFLDSVVAVIDPEMAQHSTRWNGTYTEWQTNVTAMRNFILSRCNTMANGFIGCYNLNGPYNVTIDADPAGAGNVKFNTLTINQFPWQGQYFGGMDNLLQAIPNPTWYFSNWSAVTQTINPTPTSINAKVNLTASDSIVAHFSVNSAEFEIASPETQVNVYPTLTSNSATVDFSIPESTPVTISLHSILGDQVSIISNVSNMQKGFYSVNIDFSSSNLTAGVYLVNVATKNSKKTIRIVYSPEQN